MVREMITGGDFNTMVIEHLSAIEVLITLTRRIDTHIYQVWIENYNTPNEKVVKEEVL